MKIAATLSAFDSWALDNGYDTAPAESPAPARTYADRDTQAAYDAWEAGKRHALKATIGELKADAYGIAIVCTK